MKQATIAPPSYGARAPVGVADDWDDAAYAPKWHEAPILHTGVPWADPAAISAKDIRRRLTYVNGQLVPLAECDAYHELCNGDFILRNPKGKTGISGRGLLGKWGPNHAADVVLTRRNGATGKYEVLLVEKRLEGDETALAFPAGMVEAGEDVPLALRRELVEEAVADGDAVDLLFRLCRQGVLYCGHVDDWRNTDGAWMETNAVHFHATDAIGAQLRLEVKDVEEVRRSRWVEIDAVQTMYASHLDWLHMARAKCLELEARRLAPPATTAFVSHMYPPAPARGKRADSPHDEVRSPKVAKIGPPSMETLIRNLCLYCNCEVLFKMPRGQGLLIQIDGDVEIVNGPFDGAKIRSIVGCRYQVVPCTVGELAHKFEMWMDQDAVETAAVNGLATRVFGEKCPHGPLHGNILFKHQAVEQ